MAFTSCHDRGSNRLPLDGRASTLTTQPLRLAIKVILARPVPPATIEDMLSAAEAVEAEQTKKGVPGASALAVAETPVEQPTTSSFDLTQLQTQISELTEVVAAIASNKPFDFSKVRCYRCLLYTSPSPRD